jgi:hypothetical protein
MFSIPKALDPLLSVYLHGLMTGYSSVRENSADAIGELLELTDATALRPYLIKTTGPLIRVVGDRFPSNVKRAILQVWHTIAVHTVAVTNCGYACRQLVYS